MKTLIILLYSTVVLLGCEKPPEENRMPNFENGCQQQRQLSYVGPCWFSDVFWCNGCNYNYTDGYTEFKCY